MARNIDSEALEEALDDLHMAAQLLEQLAANEDNFDRVSEDALAFAEHIRKEWNR